MNMPNNVSTSIDSKPTDSDLLVDELTRGLRETAEDVVPWFLSQMPTMYFQDTDHETQLSHLRAIIAAKASGRPIELTLRSEDGSEWTSMRPLDYPGVLAELVSDLPNDRHLRSAKIHTANDGNLVLDTFEFGEAHMFDPKDPEQASKLEQAIEYAATNMPELTPEAVANHMRRCRAEYVSTVTPLRLCKNWELFNRVSGTDGSAISLEPESDPTQCRITVAVGNATQRVMFERIARRLSQSSINIHRAYLDMIDDGKNGTIGLLGFVVQGPDGGPIAPDSALWHTLQRDLLRNKWLDDRTLELAQRHGELETTTAEVILALCDLAHQVLVKANPYAFNPDRIARLAERELAHSLSIVSLLMDRFNPDHPLDDAAFEQRSEAIRTQVLQSVDLEDARTVLLKMLDAVHAVLRTNVFVQDRYALAMRLDPNLLTTEERTEIPFGVFYVHGRGFNGFHVRFRDIARGGVRAICPIGIEQYARESERLYDEAYGLAFAQQLKNKDIPEGGAKAAVLVAPGARVSRSVKAFVDSLLDLIAPDPKATSRIVDRLGMAELLYLGPDENITPELINWIVDRARRRGYPTPTALMSSKPGAGINHKQYGVTSEGVVVFLDVALRAAGIDPTQENFTVKITGGPDGDVGGNCLRILHREYGDRAKIVGIADGSGSAEDPDGLDHTELMRLVDLSKPIGFFDRSKIGPNGRLALLDEPDGVRLRNSMHNRVVADAFVPCGGRPNTIHAGNWREFLTSTGTPSSRLIVEGANLFLTPEARTKLSEAGAMIVKDSSANKCGVICSSFEIIACMLLSEDEFLAIKDQFVDQVLVKLRMLARREAELLLRVHRHRPHIPLPDLSIRLSRVMIRTADAIESSLDTLSPDDMNLVRRLVVDHLPPVLLEVAEGRVPTHMPNAYLKWMMAKSLSARIVYREGFEYIETMSDQTIAEMAVAYLRLEFERATLAAEIASSNNPNRDRITALLDKAGILSTLGYV
jgi:glutamate dehydrogenase